METPGPCHYTIVQPTMQPVINSVFSATNIQSNYVNLVQIFNTAKAIIEQYVFQMYGNNCSFQMNNDLEQKYFTYLNAAVHLENQIEYKNSVNKNFDDLIDFACKTALVGVIGTVALLALSLETIVFPYLFLAGCVAVGLLGLGQLIFNIVAYFDDAEDICNLHKTALQNFNEPHFKMVAHQPISLA